MSFGIAFILFILLLIVFEFVTGQIEDNRPSNEGTEEEIFQ